MIGIQIRVRTTKLMIRSPKLIFILEPSMALPASVMKMIWLMESITTKNTLWAATPVLTEMAGRLTSMKPSSTAGAIAAASGSPSRLSSGAMGLPSQVNRG